MLNAFDANVQQPQQAEDDSDIQWQLFLKHHAKGSWKGIWTSYDYIGDVIDETVASVDLVPLDDERIQQTHTFVVGAKRSDCATCFDSMETKQFPVATYAKGNLRKSRLGACGLVNGPTLLKSGAMATELVLRHGDGRVRVVFQHAPVWLNNNDNDNNNPPQEPQGPPDGLKLFRCTVCREALRDAPPTAETEAAQPPTKGNPTFVRPVPPFAWHKQWAGTCWTWGPAIGNKGWGIEELEEGDAWHGEAPVELWNLRLGGLFVQAPRVVTPDQAGLCRLAWLPDKDNETLLRLEAGVLALQPIVMDEKEEETATLVGFYPPSLASLRCDVLTNVGELDGDPPFLQDRQAALEKMLAEEEAAGAEATESSNKAVEDGEASPTQLQPKPEKVEFNDDDLEDARDALQL